MLVGLFFVGKSGEKGAEKENLDTKERPIENNLYIRTSSRPQREGTTTKQTTTKNFYYNEKTYRNIGSNGARNKRICSD
jgi:hypothetical protein